MEIIMQCQISILQGEETESRGKEAQSKQALVLTHSKKS